MENARPDNIAYNLLAKQTKLSSNSIEIERGNNTIVRPANQAALSSRHPSASMHDHA
jgi:hypothetical protein